MKADRQRRSSWVDEDDALREALALALRRRGYDVVTARDGSDALMRLRRGLRSCLIILDLETPGSGFEFRRRQIKDPALAWIPLVFYSGRDDITGGAGGRMEGAEYFEPPAALDEVLEVVGEQYQRHRT